MKHLVAKYKALIAIDLKILVEYKTNFLGRLTYLPVAVFIMYVLWNIIFESSGKVTLGGLTLTETISYMVITNFLVMGIQTWTISGAVENK